MTSSVGKFLLLICLVLAGCKPAGTEVDLSQQRAAVTQRFDQFQAAARTDKAVVLVGSRGVVLVSADDGLSFKRSELRLPGAVTPSLIDVAACPDGSFAALDFYQRVWVSADDGRSWAAKPAADIQKPLALTCDPANRLWIVGSYSGIVSSADRGDHWNDHSLQLDNGFATIQFLDADHGVVTGEFGKIYATHDGGAHWDEAGEIADDFYPQTAHFATVDAGYAAGLGGSLFKTTDGGKSWEQQAFGVADPIYELVADSTRLIAVGDHGLVRVFEDGAWRSIGDAGLLTAYLRAAVPLGGDRLLVAGGSGALRIVSLNKQAADASQRAEALAR